MCLFIDYIAQFGFFPYKYLYIICDAGKQGSLKWSKKNKIRTACFPKSASLYTIKELDADKWWILHQQFLGTQEIYVPKW